MTARPIPVRHWRSYGNDPLPTGAEALDDEQDAGRDVASGQPGDQPNSLLRLGDVRLARQGRDQQAPGEILILRRIPELWQLPVCSVSGVKRGLKSRHDGTGGNPPRLAEDCEADRSVCPRCGWPKRPDRVGHKHTGHLCFHCGYSTDRDDPATAGG